MDASPQFHGLLDHDAPLRLLLIEDSTSDSELILAMLEDSLPRARIDVVANLEDALAELDRNRYDATLADLSLPDADGLAVVRAVRAAHPTTALLVHTSRADGRLAQWALAEGAQDYLVKGAQDGPHLAVALLHALQRQRAEQEAHRYLQLARALLDALEAPTCAVSGTGSIIAVNTAWNELVASTGGDPRSCGEGHRYVSVCARAAASDYHAAGAIGQGLGDVLSRRLERYQLEYECQFPADRHRWFSVRISPADIDGTRGAVISHVDVTAMHEVHESLSHQSLHDPLTGLPNRTLLSDRLSQSIVDAGRRGVDFGIGFIDLDSFKRVNDSLGHSAGDDLLVQVADRLRAQLRVGDTLARYAGDEFVVVWRDLETRGEVTGLVEQMLTALEEPFSLDSILVTLSASIGVVLSDGSQSVQGLLADADAARCDAKIHARGRARYFSEDMRRDAQDRMTMEADLRSALTNAEFVLHYQPIIELDGGRVVGVEALVRWQHPERGLLGPGSFIPVAETSRLIVPLGRWVLERACLDAAAFDGAAAGIDIAVNLSAFQLTQPDMLKHVQDALRFSGLDPARLLLEVTESALMEDEEAAALALGELSRIGVRVAIDDFGTGWSSLLYLRRFPVTALKLDRVFVSGIGTSADDEAICSSVINLAQAVGAISIGEGIETLEQYAVLRSNGCRQAQGFLWSPAVPLEELALAFVACQQVPLPTISPRPRVADQPVEGPTAERIWALHRAGASLHTIAAALNRGNTPCPTGRRWAPASVARHLAAESDLAGPGDEDSTSASA